MTDADVTLEQIEEAAKRAGCVTVERREWPDISDMRLRIDTVLVQIVTDDQHHRSALERRVALHVCNALALAREEAEQVRPSGTTPITGMGEFWHGAYGDICVKADADELEIAVRNLGGRVVWGKGFV